MSKTQSLAETLEGVTEPVEAPSDFSDLPGFEYAPTEEQVAIMRKSLEFLDVLMIEAGAGTGKTSTLEFLAAILKGLGQYTAFNKALVVESTEKFRRFPQMSCNTQHSLAFRAVGHKYSHRLNSPRVRAWQVARQLGIEDFTVQIGPEEKQKKVLAAGFLASRVRLALSRFSQSADREIQPHHFRRIDGIEQPSLTEQSYENNGLVREYLLPFAQKAWKDIVDPDGEFPFTADYYVKIWQLGKPVISADYILLDEAQDTAPVMLDVLSRQKGMVILVGDSAQQIYEWRGAVNALAAFPEAPRLFLTQSFRFGPAIAELANQILESLQEPTELRLKGLESITSTIAPVDEPDAILTRTNAVAVGYLLEGIARGQQPFLVGGGSDVISFVEAVICLQKGKSTSHPELACFESWPEVQEYATTEEGEDLKLMVSLIDSHGSAAILEALKAMPAEKDADYVISTAHKSKGRQWPKVKLAPDFPPNPNSADTDRRLLYVAVTRAQEVIDTSSCPFFVGEGAMNVESILKGSGRKAPSTVPRPPKKVSHSPSNHDPEFSWSRWDGEKPTQEWLVRGPVGYEGKTVTVTRKSGDTSRKYLLKAIWSDGDTSIYKV